ncbi:hypothetical protein EUGRSUZ_H00936 [Eucalyptus grandis]|uniref:Uncharacterized protein n=2 Tax=Eucalyptus grandis TaxID=71139 RepID=A0ACC3KC88_EUCGR|nr:hypothetical protein EUGRSUZ_H00936 [Eucalyptus grandis]
MLPTNGPFFPFITLLFLFLFSLFLTLQTYLLHEQLSESRRSEIVSYVCTIFFGSQVDSILTLESASYFSFRTFELKNDGNHNI